MIRFLILLILANSTYTSNGDGGSAIFSHRRSRTECWNEDDIVKLRARKAFEELLPAHVDPNQFDGKYVKEVIRYFRKTLRAVEEGHPHVAKLLGEAISDTIGSHLRHDILPTARFAFYAGYIPYRSVRQLHDFFDEVKEKLNTQGLGWKRPQRTPWSNLTVAKVLIGTGMFFDPCTCLVTKRDSNSCIHLPIPRLDDDAAPSAIALPFKSGGLLSLTSPNSNNMLLKYYTTAAKCILSSSPEKCRHSDFLSFNNDLWNWMKRDVAPHLMDEKLYAAFGGVLRIAASVQTYGKGLSRRNLFEYQEAALTKWNPWRSLSESRIYVDADWSPKVYIAVVVLAAIAVYLTLICYNYLCSSDSCRCKGRSNPSSVSQEIAYANVDSNIPAMLPHQSTIYYSNQQRVKRTLSKTKSVSLGSMRTQKVYDMNENTEKLMAVIMSGNESAASSAEDCEKTLVNEGKEIGPPKIETSICEVGKKRARKESRTEPMYTTSCETTPLTVTGALEDDGTYSEWSGSESSSCSRTASSTSQSQSSHDMAWVKRLISKHSARSTTKSSTSRTEEVNNSTRPPHRRPVN